jgi:hypothetical protein
MSVYAATPETYAAWRYLELNDALRPFDQEHAEIVRGDEELDLLLAGTKSLFSLGTPLCLTLSDLEKSPTVDKMAHFFKRALELHLFAQRSLDRSLERYHRQGVCLADVQARPGAYPCFGTEEEVRQRVEEFRRKHVEIAEVARRVEEGHHQYAENERLLAAVNAIIASRRAESQDDEIETSTSDS